MTGLPGDGSGYESVKRENSRRLRRDLARGAAVLRARPEIVNLNHSSFCNLRCPFCITTHQERHERLPVRVLDRVTSTLFPTALKVVLTMAGEPLLADFDFLVGQARRYGVKVDVVTNGVLLTPRRYAAARDVLDHLNVSLDSHVPEVYEATRVGAAFERVRANLLAVADLRRREPDGVLLSLSAVVQSSNVEMLAGFVRFAKEAGADGVVLQRVKQDTLALPGQDPERAFGRDGLAALLEQAAVAAREADINLIFADFGRPNVIVAPLRARVAEPMPVPDTCPHLVRSFNVLFTGEVYPCCVPTDHLLGNVHDDDALDIWNGPPMVRLREAHLSRRGARFCCGCSQAPHLPARPREPVP